MFIAKHLLNIAVVFSLLFSSMRISFTYVYYYLDPGGFTEKLCENKDKPELQCNGKCYLKKVVSKEKKENNAPLPEIEYKDLQLILEKGKEYKFGSISVASGGFDNYKNSYTFLHPSGTFHPPNSVIS